MVNAFISATLCAVHEAEDIHPPHVTLSVYTVWVYAFITTTLCTVQKVDDARSATRCIVSIYRFASTLFSGRITPSE